jgi:serine protease inhibitor
MVDALAAGGSLLDHVPKYPSKVRTVLLPKFKLSFFASLVGVLRGLGLVEAFTEEADLSGLVDQRVCDVRLDEVFHKAVVEVNEKGTKAAACTAVGGRVKQCARKPETRTQRFSHIVGVPVLSKGVGSVKICAALFCTFILYKSTFRLLWTSK